MDDELPPGIGPHEFRELELMLAGEKPLAMFNDDWPEDMEPPEVAFEPYVAEGKFVKAEVVLPVAAFPDTGLRYYFYALPGDEWRMERMIKILRGIFEHHLPTTREQEIETGRLLGYEEADIKLFVDRWFGPDK